MGFCNHFSNSCTNFCIRVCAGSNQGELKWWEIGLTPAEWTIASAEQSFLIEEKDYRLAKQQERGHHKSKMLISNPLINLWLHRKWGEGKLIQREHSWHLENYDRKGMKVSRGLLFLPVRCSHPPSHTQSGHLLNETTMKGVRARSGCRLSMRQDFLFAEDWPLASWL